MALLATGSVGWVSIDIEEKRGVRIGVGQESLVHGLVGIFLHSIRGVCVTLTPTFLPPWLVRQNEAKENAWDGFCC